MREKLFRGKRIDSGEWVYGDLVHAENKFYISYYYESALTTFINETIEYDGISIIGVAPFIEVDPSTVGQYTGLTDKSGKNGKKIFEGDIVSTPKYNGVVVYGTGCYCIKHGNNSPAIDIVMNDFDVYVIGNIHDSPELMEGKP